MGSHSKLLANIVPVRLYEVDGVGTYLVHSRSSRSGRSGRSGFVVSNDSAAFPFRVLATTNSWRGDAREGSGIATLGNREAGREGPTYLPLCAYLMYQVGRYMYMYEAGCTCLYSFSGFLLAGSYSQLSQSSSDGERGIFNL